jgi:hypothetical protein
MVMEWDSDLTVLSIASEVSITDITHTDTTHIATIHTDTIHIALTTVMVDMDITLMVMEWVD